MALQRDAAVLGMVRGAIRDPSLMNKAAPSLLRLLWRNFILIHFSFNNVHQTLSSREKPLGVSFGRAAL